MNGKEKYISSLANEYLDRKVRRRRLNADYRSEYKRVIMKLTKMLMDADLNHTPAKIGEEDIDYLIRENSDYSVSYQKWMITILNGFLKYHGNNVIDQMMLAWPQDQRTNVDWLTPQQALDMIDAAEGVERMIVHLELRLFLRRIEVRRLRVQDIQDGCIHVHGKGKGGGKWRTVSFAPETRQEIQRYEHLREKMIEEALEKEPNQQVPESFIIYAHHGWKLGTYADSSLDKIIKRVARKADCPDTTSHHTLRRTGARLAYLSGVRLVTISDALGHSDTKQTIQYLGINLNDQKKMQERTWEYLQDLRRTPETALKKQNLRIPR